MIKEEHLPDGRRKLILKDPASGEFVDRSRSDGAMAIEVVVDDGWAGAGRRSAAGAGSASSPGPAVPRHRGHAAARCTTWWPPARPAASRRRPCCCSTSSAGCRPTSRSGATPCCAAASSTGSHRPSTGPSTPTPSDLDAECRAVDAWIDAGPDGRLDLAVLGLGVNGHLGMNEPGAAIDGRTARVELAATTVEGAARYFGGRARPTWGVTVGLGDLLGAREVWVLATGAAKADDRQPAASRTHAVRTCRRRCCRATRTARGGSTRRRPPAGAVRLRACKWCRTGASTSRSIPMRRGTPSTGPASTSGGGRGCASSTPPDSCSGIAGGAPCARRCPTRCGSRSS